MLTILHSANFWIGFAIGFLSLLILSFIVYLVLKWAYNDLPNKKHNASYDAYDEFLPTAFINEN